MWGGFSLKPPLCAGVLSMCGDNGTGEQELPGDNGTGEQLDQSIPNIHQKHTRTHQIYSGSTLGAPQTPSALPEPLFKRFRQHSCAPTQRARARGIGGLFSLRIPSDRITHAGAIEISRLDSPHNLRYIYIYIYPPLRNGLVVRLGA